MEINFKYQEKDNPIQCNEADEIKDVCENFELITPIFIRIPARQSNSKKQMGRKNYKNNTKQKGKKSTIKR